MFEQLRQRFTSLFAAPVPAPRARPRVHPVPRAVRDLSVDEQVHWAYRNFRPEVARCIARGIRARAAASEGDKRPPIEPWLFEPLCAT